MIVILEHPGQVFNRILADSLRAKSPVFNLFLLSIIAQLKSRFVL